MPSREGSPAASVRAAGASDAEALARLRFEFRADLEPPVEEREAFLSRCAAWMRERLDGARGWRAWIVTVDAEIQGGVWLQLLEKVPNPVGEPETHAYVTNLYVRPERRGEGLGSALLSAALAECGRQGVDAVVLWPTPASRPLYQRYGFSVRDDVMERRLWHAP